MVVRAPHRPTSPPAEVTRSERLFLRLEVRGVAGRAAAGALHSAVIGAHWARCRRPCVILERSLAGGLRVRWTWPLHGSTCSGPRLLV